MLRNHAWAEPENVRQRTSNSDSSEHTDALLFRAAGLHGAETVIQ
jgi:hypothetical protein